MEENYLKNYDYYWKDIVENEDGTLNLDQIKKELSDFKFILEQVSQVYSYITGGKLSKQNYYADTIITVSDDYFNDLIRESKKDAFKDIDKRIEELRKDIEKYSTNDMQEFLFGKIRGLQSAKNIIDINI